ncbi:MAG: M66 family metalloprotease [Porticoccaceae bacterium]|nr:M66 family metalloprotease [Porticoccaceae bacterium]
MKRFVSLVFLFLLGFSSVGYTELQSNRPISSAPLVTLNIDIDGNQKLHALTDGLLILRSMFGLTGSSLTEGAVANDAVYRNPEDIQVRVSGLGNRLDIDNNGNVDALTDGLIILRYLFGLRGDVLIESVIASDANRVTVADVEAHMGILSSLNILPELTFTSSKTVVKESEAFTLNWSSIYADNCIASGDWTGDKPLSGAETLLSETSGKRSYTLTCTGNAGAVAKSSPVSVLSAEGPVKLEGVYLSQTHVAKPSNAYFNLTSDRSALLKVDLSSRHPDISPTVVAIITNDEIRETFALQGPNTLPLPEDISAQPGEVQHKMENSFTAIVPPELVQPNMELVIEVDGALVYDRPIDVGAPNALSLDIFDIHFFNDVTSQSDYSPNIFNEIQSKWPVSSLSVQRVRNIVFDELVIPARSDVGSPAVKISSTDEYKIKTGLNFDGEQAAALQWVHALSASGGNHDITLMYVDIVGVISGGQAGAFDGVGQRGADGILHHELGHALGLPHWRAVAEYPYRGYAYGIPSDTISWQTNEMKVNVGPVWGFDFPSMTFISPIINPNGGHKSKSRYKWDPMQGGGTGTQTPPFLLNHFSDYSVKRMQDYVEEKLAVVKDDGFFKWNKIDKDYSRAVSAPIGVRYPIDLRQNILTVMAATALADKDINMIYPPIGPYTGNLIRTFDPRLLEDRNLANELNYCPSNGCDFSLKIQQGDATRWYMLSSSASTDDDIYNQSSLTTVAVNLYADDGDITDVVLYHTPNANDMGIDNPEQLANRDELVSVDQCPANPNKYKPKLCGCGQAETDSDSDGVPDCLDQCPLDPIKKAPRECGCGNLEGTCAPEHRFEAEEASLSHAVSLTRELRSDYRGTGFVDYQGVGSWIKWDNIYAPSEGIYEAIFRYAAAHPRVVDVLVNDSVEATFGSVAGNGWNDWKEISVPLKLKEGVNVLRVVAEDSDGPNIDYMSVPGTIKSESLTNGHNDAPIVCVGDSDSDKLRVFILVGQSNMLGSGRVEQYVNFDYSSSKEPDYHSGKTSGHDVDSFSGLDHRLSREYMFERESLVNQESIYTNAGAGTLRYLVNEVNGRYAELVDSEGKWRTRDDVWIESRGDQSFSGWLSPTISNNNEFGPDFMFGNAVGDALDTDVLVIKVAWGGKSLQTDFRPPGSGGEVGKYYLDMFKHINSVLDNIENLVPNYSAADGYEISGFGWHQGWNDGGSWDAVNEYGFNLTNLINDVREELNSPTLPFVIASSGFRGFNGEVDRRESLMAIQEDVTQYPEFTGNTGFVDTRPFWRDSYESPADQVYHWNQNAETYFLIGKEMGRSMVGLACSP